jgi:hypothetical protein
MSVRNALAAGISVIKAAQNLPQTATANLFAVSGAVLVTALLGEVTTALGGTATSLSVGTTASNTAIATSTAASSLPAGAWLVPQNASGIGGALITTSAPFVPPELGEVNPFVVSAANITWTTTANDTGQVKWYLWYIPIDAGASVS